MADPSSFAVGNAPGGASYAAPLLDFSALANAPKTIFEGQQRARITALQNAFPNGLKEFTGPDGKVNTAAVSDRLLKTMGADAAKEVLPLLIGAQGASSLSGIISGSSGPSSGPASSAAAAPQAPSAPAPAPPTTQTAVYGITGQNSPGSQQPSRPSMAGDGTQQNPYRPQTQQDYNKIPAGAYWAGRTGPARPKGNEQGGSVQQQRPPSSPPSAGAASGQPAPNGGPDTGVGAEGAPSYGPTNPQAQKLREDARRLRAGAAGVVETDMNRTGIQAAKDQASSLDAQALELEKADISAREPTGTIKEYNLYAKQQRQQGQPVLSMNQWQIENEAQKAAATTSANKDVAALDEMRTTGIDAKRQLSQIDAIRTLSQRVGYGAIPSLQEWLGKYGIATKGLSDIQAYQAAISLMAPQLRPEGSGRLLQGELNAFKDSLGGLMRTPQGREIALNNLALVGKYKAEVGEIATDEKLSPAQRIRKIYTLEPPHLETTLPGQQPTGGTTTASVPEHKVGDVLINRSTGHQIKATATGWVDLKTGQPIKSDKLAK